MDNDTSSRAVSRSWKRLPMFVFFRDARLVFKLDNLAWEILGIALPAALAVAADPIASLIDTAFIGHIGPVELAAAGVSIALFNQASRITIFPLVSITTSFVAEEDTIGRVGIKGEEKSSEEKGETTDWASEDDMLEDMEKGECGKKGKELEKSSHKSSERKEFMPKNRISEGVGKGVARTSKLSEESSTESSETKNSMREDGDKDVGKKDSKELAPEEDFYATADGKAPSSTDCDKSRTKVINEKRHIDSASTALLFGAVLGVIQAIVLVLGAKPLLHVMGVKSLRDTQRISCWTPFLSLSCVWASAVQHLPMFYLST